MNKFLKQLPDQYKDKIRKKRQRKNFDPMLAKLTDDYFNDPQWIYERKLDGERCIIIKDGNEIQIKSRNNTLLNKSYPELVEAVKKLKLKTLTLDCEVVAFDGKKTSFAKLQDRMNIKNKQEAKKSHIQVYGYIFDILYLDGYELKELPLIQRKSILKKALDFNDPLRFTVHRKEKGKEYHNEACKKGWEGVIAKDGKSTYVYKRSSDWLKFKCVNEQELVIGGYTDPQGERKGFGALLVGYYKEGDLKYAGKVGTGYDDDTLLDLSKKLKDIEIQKNPFDSDEPEKKEVHFVKPKLVGQFGFTEWTDDNKLRHPRYLGLRRDKDPKKVIKEG